MRRMGTAVVTAVFLVFAVRAVATAADRPTYSTYEACSGAEHRPCEEVSGGWSPVDQVDPGSGSEVKIPVDQENLDRQRMSMATNVSGTPDHPVVAVDMNQVRFPDVQPYLDQQIGRVRVPVRFVSEQMGATVDWDGATQTVTIKRQETIIQLRVDDPVVSINGKSITIDAPPRLVDPGRVMVPLRFVSEAFGAAVDWVGDKSPDPQDSIWGKYQVWIWVDWGYWGKYTVADRLLVHHWWFYRGSDAAGGRP